MFPMCFVLVMFRLYGCFFFKIFLFCICMVVVEAYIIWYTKLQQTNIEKLPPLSKVTFSLSVPA